MLGIEPWIIQPTRFQNNIHFNSTVEPWQLI